MPVGGGDVGCNVWVENGDILFYIGRSGTFDENNSMLKLGRVRLHLSPNPFKNGSSFKQELKLKESSIEISENGTKVKLWVEVFKPVIHVEIASPVKIRSTATFEDWRTEDRSLSTEERHQCYGFSNTTPDKFPVFTRKDSIQADRGQFIWYHRNRNSELIIDKEAIQQHLGDVRNELWNPLKDRVFGGIMYGKGMVYMGTSKGIYVNTAYRGYIYESEKPSLNQNIAIVLHTSVSKTNAEWIRELQTAVAEASAARLAWKRNLTWWDQFWKRSYISINPGKGPGDKGWEIGRNYQLFRYQLGCNAFGEFPTKFNGGLFTFDADFVKGEYKNKTTPDFRRWGGGSFTAQNQRLVYWPMLKSGDFDMMFPQFDFYRRPLKNAELRTRRYWGHEGASFAEQLENSGLPAGHVYERLWGDTTLRPRSDASSTRTLVNRKGEEVKVVDYGYLNNVWVTDHYDGALEFAFMILEYQRFSGADISKYLPFIDSSVRFLDQHYQYWSQKLNGYPLDEKGKLIMYPGTAAETYKLATNPTPTISGMEKVLTGLLALSSSYGTAAQRQYWSAALKRLPEIPFREIKGHKVIAPAVSWSGIKNVELPQLYPVFPYGLYGVGRDSLQVAVDTWHFGADNKSQYGIVSWHQDAIFAARLGLTDEAKALTIEKLGSSSYRFPSFWGPGLDWAPDHNWGGSGMIGLQEMLMQTVGDKIYLLPAWPGDWNVSFKLHAPANTTVEGIIENGKVKNLRVSPASREKDVVIPASPKVG